MRRDRSHAFLLALLLALAPAPQAANAQAFVQPEGAEVVMTRAEIDETVKSLAELMATGYFDSTLGAEVQRRLSTGLKQRKYHPLTRPSHLVTQLIQDVQSVISDGHFNMLYSPPAASGFNWVNAGDGPKDEQAMLEEARGRLRSLNFGVAGAEVMDGNIGYLNLSRFDAPLELLREPLADAFSLLQHTDALIVDMRRNPGGNPECVNLAFSYFVDGPAILTTTKYTRMPRGREEYRTFAEPGGPRYLGRPVYVLTSSSTASGGEMFSYQMKHHRKATLVGATTAKTAHSFDTFRIGPARLGNVMVMLPNAHLVDEVTGTDWEGSGVAPDIETKPEQALAVAAIHAARDLLAKAGTPEARSAYRDLIDKLEFVRSHGTPSAEALAKYEGRYGIRRVWLEDGVLRFQRDNGPRVDMEAVGEHLFELTISMSPRPRVRFEVEGGVVRALHLKGPEGDQRTARD
jgi:hypothetical protein